MRLSKDILDKNIISVDEGRFLGKVKDLLVDRDLTRMTGIFINREGLFRKKTIYIPQEKVVVFGIDAILIESAESKTDSRVSPMGDWIKVSTIFNRPIDTPGGTKLATLGDVILNGEAAIVGFTLGKVAVSGTIAENRSIARASVIDCGHDDGVMTIDLSKAELLGIPDDHMGLYTPAADTVEPVSPPPPIEEPEPASEMPPPTDEPVSPAPVADPTLDLDTNDEEDIVLKPPSSTSVNG